MYPGQVQDFKSNTKGICFSEDWPEEINYHYISCKRDSQANRLKDGYTYSITHRRELTFAPS
jgi:hypothetical protein